MKAPSAKKPPHAKKALPAKKPLLAKKVSPASKVTPAKTTFRSPQPLIKAFDQWPLPAQIEENKFSFKSLSNWAYNITMGCVHACPFWYVPGKIENRLEARMVEIMGDGIPSVWRRAGRGWADNQWGNYVFLRQWDEKKFRSSLRRAMKQARDTDSGKLPEEVRLPKDGNRAIMLCTTTDPYQTLIIPGDIQKQKLLNDLRANLVRKALQLILDESDLNVRILTRSPLAVKDFDLYKKFGNRLAFGMSFPTNDDALSSIYEPRSPGPTKKMEALKEAVEQGLHVYVALAPTMPEQSESDLRETMEAIAELKPMTIFHEPINIRAGNIARIKAEARSLAEGEKSAHSEKVLKQLKSMRSEVFDTNETWREYAYERFALVDKIAREMKLPAGVLHQWPDKVLATQSPFMDMKLMQAARSSNVQRLSSAQKEEAEAEWAGIKSWIDYWHSPNERISSWPGIRMPKWK